MHQEIVSLLASVVDGKPLSGNTVQKLLPLLKEHRLDLHAVARLTFSYHQTREVFTCGIINAKSGRCAEDCSFCAQSAHHAANTAVYGLVDEESLVKRAAALAGRGARYMGIVLSGTSPTVRDFDVLCEVAGRIRSRVPIELCASFGLLSNDQAVSLKEAGYSSYHHNLETAQSWYGQICTTHGYDARLKTVANARAAGLRVCCGGIFGLGEGWKERLEFSETLGQLMVDSIPVNFLTPIPGTPLEGSPLLPPEEVLDIIAIFRLMHPEKDIIVCGGRSKVLGDWDRTVFHSGASAIMIGDYLTTRGTGMDKDRELLRTLGLMG